MLVEAQLITAIAFSDRVPPNTCHIAIMSNL